MIPNQILFLLLRLYNLAFNNISYLQRKSCVMGTLYTPTSNTLNYKSGHYPNAAESIILLGFFSMFHEIHLFPRGNLPVRHATVVVAAGMLNCLQAALQFGGPGSKICNQSFHANNKNVCKTMP